jgi:hypothetical protein
MARSPRFGFTLVERRSSFTLVERRLGFTLVKSLVGDRHRDPANLEAAFAKRGKPLPPNPIPAKYNTQSTLALEITAGKEDKYAVVILVTK